MSIPMPVCPIVLNVYAAHPFTYVPQTGDALDTNSYPKALVAPRKPTIA